MPTFAALHLQFGVPSSRLVDPLLHQFIVGLAGKVFPETGSLEDLSPPQTLYLRSSDISQRPETVGDVVQRYVDATGRLHLDLLVLDLSANPFELLREPALYYLGRVATSLLGSLQVSFCSIIVPQVPVKSSLLWEPLQRLTSGGVVVVSRSGGPKMFGPDSMLLSSTFAEEFARQSVDLIADPLEEFRAKTVRKLGHYSHGTDGKFCSKQFLDASLCVPQIVDLMLGTVTRMADVNPAFRVDYLATYAPLSPWLRQVAVLLADEIGAKTWFLDDPSASMPVDLPTGIEPVRTYALLLVDFVHSGAACRLAVRALGTLSVDVVSPIMTVWNSGGLSSISEAERSYVIEAIDEVEVETIPQAKCPQCQLSVPHCNPLREPYFGMSTYTMWDIVRRVPMLDQEIDIPLERGASVGYRIWRWHFWSTPTGLRSRSNSAFDP